MKKLVLSALLACSLCAKGEVYTDVIKPIFSDATSEKSIGRLLPTNAVKILQTSGERVQIRVQGFQNPAVSNVIYYSDSQRVIAAAFSKTADVKFKLLEKGKNGKWDKVEASVYTTKDGFTSELAPMFARAEQIYKESCGVCHGLHATTHYKANQWPNLLKSMLSRTAIEKKDEWLVIEYLQKHSEDVNADRK